MTLAVLNFNSLHSCNYYFFLKGVHQHFVGCVQNKYVFTQNVIFFAYICNSQKAVILT